MGRNKRVTFEEWVHANGGANQVALELGVNRRTVRYWMNRERVPRTEHIIDIVALSKNVLSHESIYNDTCKKEVKHG